MHDPVVNMARLSGANLRYVQAKLPHLQRVLHNDPVDALDGAHVAIVSSADAARRRRRASAPTPRS